MSDTVHHTDVAIIGAGPVGLFAVFTCGMVKLKCHVVDVMDGVGGQCSALYPEKPIYDIPGHPSILASELIDRLEAQAAPFEPVIHLGQQVEKLERQGGGRWRITTSRGVRIEAGAVIIAAGVGAFGPNRPPLANLASFEGTSVFYMVRRREDFRGKRVVIAGGGDSAVDWALSLAEVAARVMVVHRRPKFRATPESAARLQKLADEGGIDLVTPYQLSGLRGHEGRLEAVDVADLDGKTRSLEADVLLSLFGLAQELGPIATWGLDLDRARITVDPATCMTQEKGVFAIGDIASYPGKLKLILSGFADAATAAHAAHAVLHPDEALHFEHSTSSGIPTLSPAE